MSLRRLLGIGLLLGMAGCAALTGTPREPVSRPQRESIEAFSLSGRIVVRRGAERFAAAIDWRHDRDGDEIVLSGPLGQGLARLTANATGALLETAGRGRFEASDMDSLAERVFGASLPVAGMAHWLLGRPAHGGSVLSRDASNRPAVLAERGWTIDFEQYESDRQEALPTLLRARREEVEVRLAIEDWDLP